MSYYSDSKETITRCDPSLKRGIEILLYPGFWAIGTHKISHFLYGKQWFFLARFCSQLARWFTGIEIHPGAVIGKRLFIDHGMGVVIGETCVIGNDVIIFQGVTLGGTGKDIGKRHPTIGNNVLIGAGAKILGPFTIGDSVRVGAGSVVLKPVSPNCTVVGIPARAVRNCDIDFEQKDNLDTIHYPDVITNEIADLKKRMEELELLFKQVGR